MKETPDGNLHQLHFEAFSIQAPVRWQKVDGQDHDNANGRIAIGQDNELQFNLSPDAHDVSMYRQLVVTDVTVTDVVEYDEEDEETESFAERPRIVETSETRLSQTYESDIHAAVINGMEATVLIPQQPGKGVIGVSLSNIGTTGNRFSLFGVDLKPENETVFLAVMKTLKFYTSE